MLKINCFSKKLDIFHTTFCDTIMRQTCDRVKSLPNSMASKVMEEYATNMPKIGKKCA